MARKPLVPFKMRVRAATKTLLLKSGPKQKITPAAFIREVVCFYEMFLYNFRSGSRIGAVSSDQRNHAPNLLVMTVSLEKRRSTLTVWMPRTLRARCLRLTRLTGTDDPGVMFEKAATLYATCQGMNKDGWTFYEPKGSQMVQVRLFR